jgi:hypothetical protein
MFANAGYAEMSAEPRTCSVIRYRARHIRCPTLAQLEEKVIAAVRGAYDARAEINRAIKEKKEFVEFARSLATHREKERAAVRSLDAHRQEHGC